MPRRPIRREQALASLDLPGQRIDYLIKRSSARRSLALRVNADGRAQVNAPLSMPMARIEAFLFRHADWLRKQLAGQDVGSDWREGMPLPYLGGELRLALSESAGPAAVVDGGRLCCPARDSAGAAIAWYRQGAARLLAERLDAACRRIGREMPAWRLSDARTRWGSLSPAGVVGLNWRLVKAGLAEMDYVICHELAHFRHRDHSAAYWGEVERIFPDFREARARLRRESARYMAF